jgi:uncharacterized protein (TIGR00251 family)
MGIHLQDRTIIRMQTCRWRIIEKSGRVSFLARVQPRASHNEIVGEYQHGLKIRLTAPPVNDRANEALRKLLASRLKVPVAAVRIASGECSRTKRVEVHGVTAATIRGLAG